MPCDLWPLATPCSQSKMMGCEESEIKLVKREEAVVAPGPPPEPRALDPGAPEPEPGLDLSLSPRSESPERQTRSPRRRKWGANQRGGARKGRQVSWRKAWLAARQRPCTHFFTTFLSATRSASAWRHPPRPDPSLCRSPPHLARSLWHHRTWVRLRSTAAWL